MTTKQENFISMVRAVNKLLQDNQKTWAGVNRFARAVTELKDLISLIGTVGAKANSPITGATKDKWSIEDEAVDQGVNLAKLASVYALDEKNMELHDKLRISRSRLLHLHEDECLKRLMDVLALLQPLSNDLADFGIVHADVVHFKSLLDAYEAALAKPRQLTVERKTMNTTQLPDLISKMRQTLYVLDSMINRFKQTPLPAQYKNARLIVDLGSRFEEEEEKEGGEEEKPDGLVV